MARPSEYSLSGATIERLTGGVAHVEVTGAFTQYLVYNSSGVGLSLLETPTPTGKPVVGVAIIRRTPLGHELISDVYFVGSDDDVEQLWVRCQQL